MNNGVRTKLVSCFQIVFPDLPAEQIPAASQETVEMWDSVAAVTLLNVIEEEMHVTVDLERLPEFTSFTAIEAYLSERQ